MPQRLKLTTSKTDENEFSSISEMLKIDFRNMAHAHLASQESELVMQSYGMSSYWWNVIHDKKEEIEEAHRAKLKKLKVFDGIPQAECPSCKAISLLTVTKCPNCGMQFENGV